MSEHKPIRLTKDQRKKLFEYRVGAGIVAYKSAQNCTTEFEFYTDRKGQMRYVANGALVAMGVTYDDDGFEDCVSHKGDALEVSDELAIRRGQVERFYQNLAEMMGIEPDQVMPPGESLHEQIEAWLASKQGG